MPYWQSNCLPNDREETHASTRSRQVLTLSRTLQRNLDEFCTHHWKHDANLVCGENGPDWQKLTGIRMAMLVQFSLACSASSAQPRLRLPPIFPIISSNLIIGTYVCVIRAQCRPLSQRLVGSNLKSVWARPFQSSRETSRRYKRPLSAPTRQALRLRGFVM